MTTNNQELRAIYQWLLFTSSKVGMHHKYISTDQDGGIWVWSVPPVSSINGLSTIMWHNSGSDMINTCVGKIPDHFLKDARYDEWRHSLCKIEDVLIGD